MPPFAAGQSPTSLALRIQCLLEPIQLMIFFAVAHLSSHILLFTLRLISSTPAAIAAPPSSRKSVPSASDLAFSLAFSLFAPSFHKGESEGPLPSLVAQATGSVLEIGPGAGSQVVRYDRAKVTKVVGVEVSEGLRRDLEGTLRRQGGWDISFSDEGRRGEDMGAGKGSGSGKAEYEIVPAGVEGWLEERVKRIEETRLANGGEAKGDVVEELMFDSVLACLVLCSVDRPQRVCRDLYKVLKPGGKMIVMEHVRRNENQGVSGIWLQKLYNVPWSHLLAGCRLDRETETYLREAGEWESVELTQMGHEMPWFLLPKVWGTMVKAQ
ncbi:hypothetical protein MMC10_009214 [Thelotrema lepadinum]|nr:hypothetical protein [Thelotrema lepadinum]